MSNYKKEKEINHEGASNLWFAGAQRIRQAPILPSLLRLVQMRFDFAVKILLPCFSPYPEF
jgi:hypothetical protein